MEKRARGGSAERKMVLAELRNLFLRNAALRVACIYALLSAAWIIFSDQILLLFIEEARTLTWLQTMKGWVFIIGTALIVYLLLHREIAKLQEAESEAKESERKLVTLMGNLPGMAYRSRPNENRTMELVSNGSVELTGYRPADLLENRTIAYNELVHPADRQAMREKIDLALARREPFQLTYRLRTANNQEKWVWEQGVGIFSEEGEILALEGFLTDITERKQAEETLHLYRDHLEDLVKERTVTLNQEIAERQRGEEKIRKSYLFETTINSVLKISLAPLALDEQMGRILDLILAIPLLSLEGKGCIFLVEEEPEVLVMKAQRGLGENVVRACGRVPFGTCLCGQSAATAGLVFADCLAACHQCYREVFPHGHYCMPIMSGAKVLGVLNLLIKEGHRRDRHEEGFLSSIAATLAGIIERNKTELEKEGLQKKLIESEKLSALARMMASVAHEIRNPLTALGGLTRRLERRIPEGTKEKEYAGVIIAEAARLERILKSVLILTKGPSALREENDLNEVIAETLQPFAASFQKKSIEIGKSFADLPAIPMNRDEIKEAVGNILGNALYATPAGGRVAVATETEFLDGSPHVAVKITDTGAGIAADELDKIFEPFYTTRPVGPDHGIGLGLSISRKIVEEHGGLIRVASRLGEGTAFTLYFPYPGASRPKR